MVGKTFGQRYKIIEELDKGGMGTVYKAQHRYLDQEVAVKVLPLYSDDTLKQRFLNEALKAMACRHRNVVGVYDYVEEKNGVRLLIMEYVPGVDLKTFIAQHEGNVPIPVVVEVIKQLCSGLAEIHRHEIVHRDLKPENIRVQTLPDDELRVVIIDFGIAKADGDLNLTDHGSLVGTYAYMSPEQINGEQVDTRADIYALGVLIYYLMVGNPPFESTNPEGFIKAHLTEDPPLLKKKRKGLPRSFQKILLQALAKKTGSRFQKVQDMWQAFDDAVRPRTPIYKKASVWIATSFVVCLGFAWFFQEPLLETLDLRYQPVEEVDGLRLAGDQLFFDGAYEDAHSSYEEALKGLNNQGLIPSGEKKLAGYLENQIARAELLAWGNRAHKKKSDTYNVKMQEGDKALSDLDIATAIARYRESLMLLNLTGTERKKLQMADSLYGAQELSDAQLIYEELLTAEMHPAAPLQRLIQSIRAQKNAEADTIQVLE